MDLGLSGKRVLVTGTALNVADDVALKTWIDTFAGDGGLDHFVANVTVRALVTVVNNLGNLGPVDRCSMAFCAARIFIDGVPDLRRLVLAGVNSAMIGVVPGTLATVLPIHSPRPELLGASIGPVLQGSNIAGLIGPPITGALVASGGWPAAAWLTSTALGVVAASALFLHWLEKRKLAA